jgi:hypothetical protein
MTDDIDDFLETPAVDLFSEEVEAIVISFHAATLKGIRDLDQQAVLDFRYATRTEWEEGSPDREWWSNRVSRLRYHAGNLGLVSLIMLFDQWLIDFQRRGIRRKILTQVTDKDENTLPRFRRIKKELEGSGGGVLSESRFQEILTARNSIVHHAAAPEHEYLGRPSKVEDEFIKLLPDNELIIGLDKDDLIRVTNEINRQVDFWNNVSRTKLSKGI